MSVIINGDTGIDKITDGSIVTADFATSVPLGTKNLIINGDMRIAQRGTSTASITTGGYYTVDRWRLDYGTAGTWTMSQDTDVPTGQGFATSMKWDCTTANASLSAGSAMIINQRIEGQNLQHLKKGTSNAESVTLSFWVKSNKTGTYIAEINDNDNTRQISKSYTIASADTWEKKTLTFAGDTTGTLGNDNDTSLLLNLWLVAGTDLTSGTLNTSWASVTAANRAVGQVNLADNTANYINITGVQLEIGDTATPFEYMPYDLQLQRCRRYYERSTGDGTNRDWFSIGVKRDGYNLSDATVAGIWRFTVTKRANPTVASSGASAHSYHYNIASSDTFNSIGWYTDNENSVFFQGELPSVTDVSGGLLARELSASVWMEADAEL